MSNLNKPIRFTQLQKLAITSISHGVHVKEMAKTSAIVFMKARKSLVVRWRNVSIEKKKFRIVEIYFFKVFANRF